MDVRIRPHALAGAVTPPPRATRMPGESIEPEATAAPTGLTV